MTAATVTQWPSTNPNMKFGSATCADGYTFDTGIESNDLTIVITPAVADTIVTISAVSAAGVATVAMKTAAGAATAQTVYWIAVKQPGGV